MSFKIKRIHIVKLKDKKQCDIHGVVNCKIMDGKKLIEYICVLLDNQDKRLTDSNIVMQLRTMNEHTLKTLANKNEN